METSLLELPGPSKAHSFALVPLWRSFDENLLEADLQILLELP